MSIVVRYTYGVIRDSNDTQVISLSFSLSSPAPPNCLSAGDVTSREKKKINEHLYFLTNKDQIKELKISSFTEKHRIHCTTDVKSGVHPTEDVLQLLSLKAHLKFPFFQASFPCLNQCYVLSDKGTESD